VYNSYNQIIQALKSITQYYNNNKVRLLDQP